MTRKIKPSKLEQAWLDDLDNRGVFDRPYRKWDGKHCPVCGKPLEKNKDEFTGWDGYTWRFTCDCVPKNIRISIG